jgi:hypothetical protein
MKNGTVIPVFGEAIEIVASSASTNYAFVIGVQTSPPGGGLDEYFAEISPLKLPQDMERLNEISRFYRYEYLPSGN